MSIKINSKLSVSNILILVSAIFTLIAYANQGFYAYGMNTVFLNTGQYHVYAMQFFSSQFLHGGILHLAMNAIFIFIFGNTVENILGANKYALFFILSSLFTGLAITLFGSGNTVGISGFAMAIMAYYTLYLKSRNHPDYKGGITALVINIGIGLSPGISLLGHLFGAIAGGIYYYILKVMKKLS